MRAEDLMAAMGYVGSEKVKELIDQMNNTERKTRRTPRGKTGGALLAAALAVSLLTVSAFAAERYFGLFDFFGGRGLPEEARGLVEHDVPAASTAEDDGFPLDCRVTEALSDGHSVRLVAELSADEAAGLLLVPEDALESDYVRDFGIDSDLTLAEYAREKRLEPLWVGVSVKYDGALDIGAQSMEQRAVSDGVMDIMITAVAGTPAEDMTFTLVCTARGRDAKTAADVARRELTVTLKNGAQSTVTEYVPAGDGAVPGTAVTLVSVAVTQTAVETYLEVHYTADYASVEEMYDEALFFRVYAPDGTELTGSSASVGSEDGSLSANGEYTGSFVLQKRDIGDVFTLEAFNCMEKNIYGRVEMIAK